MTLPIVAEPARRSINVLLLEDRETDAELLIYELRRAGFAPHWTRVETERDFLAAIEDLPDIILSDYSMPQFSGLRAAELLRQSGLNIPFILISGTVGEDIAVAAMQNGATDYLLKDRIGRLGIAVERALGQKHLRCERDQAEAALRKAEALQNAIFNSANFSSIVTDTRGVIQIFNVGAERMLGYMANEVVGKITPADISDPLECIARASSLRMEPDVTVSPGFEAMVHKASRGSGDIHELTYIRKDGTRFPAVVSVTALRDPHDSIIGYLLISTDNTARKQVEEERRRFGQELQETNAKLELARAAAEKANLAKSEFLSSMSHELRSPLNAILGFAQLMESASPSPTAVQARSIAQILQAGWYLLKLINEVLDLSGIESGKVSMSKEAVSLSELMSECESMMESQAREQGIRMTFPRFDNPVFVIADRTRLKQIVINLVSNAIKYNRQGGAVFVFCTVISPPPPALDKAGLSHVRISVRDTGQGLSPGKLAQLFSPFNRLGQESGTVAGTGIGLVVSKRLAELMGGVMGVESTVGEGSVFWCDMRPAEDPGDAIRSGDCARPASPIAFAAAARRTVLYVEDNPANVQLIQQLLSRVPDLELTTAVNGTLGIELARSIQPRVIVMDINLPGISGVKALQFLLGHPATAHIPVVALSANAMPRDVEEGLKAGFFRYLTKPINITEFMETLHAALDFSANAAAPALTEDHSP